MHIRVSLLYPYFPIKKNPLSPPPLWVILFGKTGHISLSVERKVKIRAGVTTEQLPSKVKYGEYSTFPPPYQNAKPHQLFVTKMPPLGAAQPHTSRCKIPRSLPALGIRLQQFANALLGHNFFQTNFNTRRYLGVGVGERPSMAYLGTVTL